MHRCVICCVKRDAVKIVSVIQRETVLSLSAISPSTPSLSPKIEHRLSDLVNTPPSHKEEAEIDANQEMEQSESDFVVSV